MKLAHLILAHANPSQLDRLIKKIAHPDADIYIHIDKKSVIDQFLFLNDIENVKFIKGRTQIFWGTYSMVQATLGSFEEIINSGCAYTHINLLSVQDYPLTKASAIHEFFLKNQHKTFMHSLHIPNEWDEAIHRIKTYNFGDYRFKGHYALQHIIKFLGIRRGVPGGVQPYGRSQWFTITPVCAAYVVEYLKNNPVMKRFFRMSFAPDEFVFQTVLMNSPFKENLVNDNLRYIDFSLGGYHPKPITIQDAPDVINSGKLYARKFDSTSIPLMDFLDDHMEDMPVYKNDLVIDDKRQAF